MNKNKKVSVFTILIFILCGILLIYTILSTISVTAYMKEMIGYGSVTIKDNFFDIINYYMANSFQYIIYIAILLSIWWVGRIYNASSATQSDEKNTIKNSAAEIKTEKNEFEKKPAVDAAEKPAVDAAEKPAVDAAKETTEDSVDKEKSE